MFVHQTRDRFRRHAVEIVALVATGALLGVAGVFPDGQPLWVVPSVMLAGASAVTVVYTWLGGRPGTGAERARIVVQTGVLTVMTYATGWGYALPLVQLFAVADNVRHGGARTVRSVIVAAAGWTALAQLLLTVGLAPNVHDPVSETWAIATFMVLAVTGVSLRIRAMAELREAADAELASSEERFRVLVERSSDVVMVVRDGVVEYASPTVRDVLGLTSDEIVGLDYVDRIHPEDRESVVTQVLAMLAEGGSAAIECRLAHADGRWVPVETRVRDLTSTGSVAGYVLNVRDITDRRELERQLAHRAFHDPLTELPNRALFRDRVEHAIARVARTGGDCSVLFLDLDGFKDVNDTLGHAVGDSVLTAVAERVLEATREADTVARLGGDEFAILIEDAESEHVAARVAERVLEQLAEPIRMLGRQLDIGGSIGIAVWQPGWTQQELTRNADVAMYAAKAAGRGTFKVFEPAMHARVVERLEMERELRAALADDALELHYQPIVSLADDRIVGVEALARWPHAKRGMISPGQFIPIAESTGLIVPLGRWALRTALGQVAAWQGLRGGEPLGVSVNVATQQLVDSSFVDDVAGALADTGVVPSSVTLEITESALLSDSERTIERLHALKALGVRLAIDDFGTGYSSLSYLQRFPLDELKIDRTFIMGIAAGTESHALVQAIVDMSRSLALQTVAEGIEDLDELSNVKLLSCQLGQGYLFGRPAPATEMAQALD